MAATVDLTIEVAKRRLEVKAELRKKDMHLPRRPGYEVPKLTPSLTDLSAEDVMDLLVRFTRYIDYVSGQLVEVEIDEGVAETVVEMAKARHLVKTWTGASGDRVAVQKAEALTDPLVIEHSELHGSLKARRKLLVVMFESLQRDANVVSREITRRGGGATINRRVDYGTP